MQHTDGQSGSKSSLPQGDCLHLEGGRHAILLFHGLLGSPTEVMYVAKQLNRRGYTVRIPTLPGHQTSINDLANTAWQDWCYTAEVHFEYLSTHYARVSVSGLCLGSVLALHLAAQKRERVTSVIAMSTTLAYDGSSFPWYSFVLPLVLHTPLKHLWSYKHSSSYYDCTPAKNMLEMRRLICATKKQLGLVTAPTLILHAEKDEVASVRHADYLERHLGSLYTRKIILDDCYHLITIDNQRALVVEEAVRFLVQQDEHAWCRHWSTQARQALQQERQHRLRDLHACTP